MNNNISRENRLALIIVAIIQSLALMLLHEAIDHKVWPVNNPEWLHAFYTIAVGLPLFLYLGAIHWRDKANGIAALVLAPVLFWLGWHNGWLSAPALDDIDYRYFGGLRSLAGTLLLALFILGFFFRTWREHGRLDYSGLLENSWRNALTFAFLGLFIGVFWLLLVLWAMLFAVIDIDFFAELFVEPVFIYPVTGLVGGWGLGLIRSRESMIATVRNLCEALTRALLPLICVILILFLAALPFTGIQPLWETGRASVLMLCLGAVLLYFFNAAAAESDQPFETTPWLQRLFLIALALSPVTLLLALWSLGLRIDQYGLTVSRLWGLFIAIFIALFSLGYALLVLLHRGLQIQRMRQWNTALGVVLALGLLLVHTPLLDFHRLSLGSQLARLQNGSTPAEEFDARYLRFNLGTYGANALKELQTSELAKNSPELKTNIDNALTARNRWQRQTPALQNDTGWRRDQFQTLPDTELSDEFLESLDPEPTMVGYCLDGVRSYCVLGDFNYRNQRYRAATTNQSYVPPLPAWQWRDNRWQLIGTTVHLGCADDETLDMTQPFTAVDSEFIVFRNGSCLYQLQLSEDFIRDTLIQQP